MFSLAERRAGRRPGAEGITYTHTLTEVPIHGLTQQAPTSCQICATQCNFWCNAAYLTRTECLFPLGDPVDEPCQYREVRLSASPRRWRPCRPPGPFPWPAPAARAFPPAP